MSLLSFGDDFDAEDASILMPRLRKKKKVDVTEVEQQVVVQDEIVPESTLSDDNHPSLAGDSQPREVMSDKESGDESEIHEKPEAPKKPLKTNQSVNEEYERIKSELAKFKSTSVLKIAAAPEPQGYSIAHRREKYIKNQTPLDKRKREEQVIPCV
jgi:hypothetical protein